MRVYYTVLPLISGACGKAHCRWNIISRNCAATNSPQQTIIQWVFIIECPQVVSAPRWASSLFPPHREWNINPCPHELYSNISRRQMGIRTRGTTPLITSHPYSRIAECHGWGSHFVLLPWKCKWDMLLLYTSGPTHWQGPEAWLLWPLLPSHTRTGFQLAPDFWCSVVHARHPISTKDTSPLVFSGFAWRRQRRKRWNTLYSVEVSGLNWTPPEAARHPNTATRHDGRGPRGPLRCQRPNATRCDGRATVRGLPGKRQVAPAPAPGRHTHRGPPAPRPRCARQEWLNLNNP